MRNLLAAATVLWGSGALAGGLQLEMDKASTCPSRDAVRRAIQRSPAPTGDGWKLIVEPVELPTLRVALLRAGTVVGERRFAPKPGDCEDVARTIAYLARAWSERLAPLPPATTPRPFVPPAPPAPAPVPRGESSPVAEPATPAPAPAPVLQPVPEVTQPLPPSRERRDPPRWSLLGLGGASELGPGSTPTAQWGGWLERGFLDAWAVGARFQLDAPRTRPLGPGELSFRAWSASLSMRRTLLRRGAFDWEVSLLAGVEHLIAGGAGYSADRQVGLWEPRFAAGSAIRVEVLGLVIAMLFIELDGRGQAQGLQVENVGAATVLPAWTASAGLGLGFGIF